MSLKSKKLYSTGLKVLKLLTQKGHQAFFVGGMVRNKILKRESDNIDIATDATPNQVETILRAKKLKPKPVGKKFGTILVIVDSIPVEITTFRAEGRYSDNRHPDQVEFIKEYLNDAKRRDFTINALYEDSKGKIYDPTGGLKDIKRKLIKFVGDPKKRIDEDALRMLRGVRLATQLGFKLEKNTFAAIKTRAKYIQSVSGERVKAELDKILIANASSGPELLQEIGLLKFICPELDGLKNIYHGSIKYHLEGPVFKHAQLVVEALTMDNLNLKYAAVFHDVGKVSTGVKDFKDGEHITRFTGHELVSVKIFDKFARKFKFSRKDREDIMWLIAEHDEKKKFFEMSEAHQIKYAMHENFDLLLDIWQADTKGNISTDANEHKLKPRRKAYDIGLKLSQNIKSREHLINKLANGNLIMKYSKLKPGRELGAKIEDVKVQVILGKIKSDKELKGYLRR